MNPRKIIGKELSQTTALTSSQANGTSKDNGPYFKNAAMKKRPQVRS